MNGKGKQWSCMVLQCPDALLNSNGERKKIDSIRSCYTSYILLFWVGPFTHCLAASSVLSPVLGPRACTCRDLQLKCLKGFLWPSGADFIYEHAWALLCERLHTASSQGTSRLTGYVKSLSTVQETSSFSDHDKILELIIWSEHGPECASWGRVHCDMDGTLHY